MGEELYVNKIGWKCVRSQLAKTDGRDPIEYERVRQMFKESTPAQIKAEQDKLKVRIPEFVEA